MRRGASSVLDPHRGRRGLGALLAALWCVAMPRHVLAHPGHLGIRADRYLKLEVQPGGVRLVVSLTLGPVAADRWLRTADTDGDDSVSEQEAAAFMKRWAEALARELPLEVDGEVRALRWQQPFMDPIGPIEGRPITVEMVGRAPLDGGRHHVLVRDKMLKEAFDRTDVALEVRPPVRMLAAGPGEAPSERLRRFAVRQGESMASFSLVVEVPGTSHASRRRWGRYLTLGALAVLGLAVWLGLGRRRAGRYRRG